MNRQLIIYIKTAFRSLDKHRLSGVINIGGLAIGMAACLIITFYIKQEMSYDKFYDDSDQVYRLNTYWKQEQSDEKFATSPPPLAPLLKQLSPEVVEVTRVYKTGDFTMRPDHDFEKPFRETNAWLVDENFLDVLDHGILAGDKETMLSQPRSVVLPKSTAIRYFGEEAFEAGNIVGRQLGGGGDGGTKWQVTGVIPDQPENSHFQFDMLLTPESQVSLNQQNWGWLAFYSYIKVRDNNPETLANVENQLEYIVRNHAARGFNVDLDELRAQGLDMRFSIQSLEDIHLHSSLLREMRPNGNIVYVRSMIIVAVFIIVLACVNFINLTTARSTTRAKEVGIRKVLGSKKTQLISQFLTESLLMSFLALFVAFGLVEFAASILKSQFGWAIDTTYLREASVFPIIAGLVLILGILAGLYPAFYLTRFQPSHILKGKSSSGAGEQVTRNLLVSFQFVVSIGLIISTLIINNQVSYIQNKDLGFNKENVLIIQNDREIDERRQEFKDFLLKNAKVVDVGFATGIPGLPQYMRRDFSQDGINDSQGINWFEGDDTFLNTINAQIVAGRGFDRTIPSDTASIILNQTASKELGEGGQVGAYLTINRGDVDERRVQVVGIVKDFNLQSFDRKIGTLAIEYLHTYEFKDYIAVKLAAGDLNESIDVVKAAWSEFEPNVPLVYSFLDQDFDRLFKSEKRLSSIFNGFTVLAVLIACLGLFGLASYNNALRTKEISIRKVLGASLLSILALLYKSYLKIILISFVLASVLAYYFASEWLAEFAYKAQMSSKPFAVALFGTLLVAILTVAYHSIKTAMTNPVDNLKDQ